MQVLSNAALWTTLEKNNMATIVPKKLSNPNAESLAFLEKCLKRNTTSSTKRSITCKGKPRIYTTIYNDSGSVTIPSFGDIPISTMTIITSTNLFMDTDKLFAYLPYTDYVLIKKKRGRKSKVQIDEPNRFVPPGSIISLRYKGRIRGVNLKKGSASKNMKKPKEKVLQNNSEKMVQKLGNSLEQNYWRHAVTIVMLIEQNKTINAKVSRNGKIQLTGCRSTQHAIEFIKYLYSLMIEAEEWSGETLFSYHIQDAELTREIQEADNIILSRDENQGLMATFRTVMVNMDWDMGFKIRRDLLSKYLNKNTDFRGIYEASISTSVNVKISCTNRLNKNLSSLIITSKGECIEKTIPLEEYWSQLNEKDRKSESNKESYHTFLVFASGSVIMSSCGDEMPEVFQKFIKTLLESKEQIEDKDMIILQK